MTLQGYADIMCLEEQLMSCSICFNRSAPVSNIGSFGCYAFLTRLEICNLGQIAAVCQDFLTSLSLLHGVFSWHVLLIL